MIERIKSFKVNDLSKEDIFDIIKSIKPIFEVFYPGYANEQMYGRLARDKSTVLNLLYLD